MNTRHTVIAFDNSAAAGTENVQLNVPWPSIMKVRQIEFHNDGTGIGSYLLTGNWVPEAGVLGACHDGTSVAPHLTYYIPNALQGTFTVNVRASDNSVSGIHAIVVVVLEFSKFESDEKKST